MSIMVTSFLRSKISTLIKPTFANVYGRLLFSRPATMMEVNIVEDKPIPKALRIDMFPKEPSKPLRAIDFYAKSREEALIDEPNNKLTERQIQFDWDRLDEKDKA